MAKILFPIPLTLTAELAASIEAQLKSNDDQIATLQKAAEEASKEIEELEESVDEKDEQIKTLNAIIGKANTATATKIDAADKPSTETTPAKLVVVGDKEYKWNVAAFRLPGDATRHLAADVAADKDQVIIKKVLAIKGQKVLTEQA